MSSSGSDFEANSGESSEGYVAEPKKKAPARPRKTPPAKKSRKATASNTLDDTEGSPDEPVSGTASKAKRATPAQKKKKLAKNETEPPVDDNKNEVQSQESEADSEPDDAPPPPKTTIYMDDNRHKTVEQIYQKKSQLEHILLRPDTYIGSVESHTEKLWVFNEEEEYMEERTLNIVPGLFKIFDEILVNAADNKIRDSTMTTLKVDIDPEKNTISVFNNGRGIPIKIHEQEKVYVPELIFGHLLTSSNYDDSEKRVVGGRNGYGAKLCNIFSKEFIVETADRSIMQRYVQKFSNNMSKIGKPQLYDLPTKSEEFTRITFKPDLAKFGMTELDKDIVDLFKRRVYDMCGTVADVAVYLNKKRLPLRNFKSYTQLFHKKYEQAQENVSKLHYERISERWEVAYFTGEFNQLQQVSFVNSISTSKGGSHVNYLVDKIVKHVQEELQKKKKKSDTKFEPRAVHIKSHLFVLINSLIDNPSFDSQTKENMTLKPSKFGSTVVLSESFLKNLSKNKIFDFLSKISEAKNQQALDKSLHSTGRSRVDVENLSDANFAGTKKSKLCTLILTEGMSALNLAVAGLGELGRDYYGAFPLRGKLLNVREASVTQITNNNELKNICQIVGLSPKITSTDKLRYGHIMIMTDQDHDGSHIKGLLINYIEFFYPALLKIPGFMKEFITPIIKATRKGKSRQGRLPDPRFVKSFFTIPQYEQWKESDPAAKHYDIKYYKGLATSETIEGKQYFRDLDNHQKEFREMQDDERPLFELAFSKKKADARKDWLAQFQPGTFLDHSADRINYSDFVNKELIQFSMADNVRSIPSVLDGLKPGQRKIMFGCFTRNQTNQVKVSQLIGYISERTSYHHGEQSLASTIIGLAQNFVGSNNINLLYPAGQFGSRAMGGKDAGSSRYVNTFIMDVSTILFNKSDNPLLNYLDDDGTSIEPEWYIPIVPLVLVNGADGIGTGWSTNIPCYNPKDIVANLRRHMTGEVMETMVPWYRGFTGEISMDNSSRFKVSGKIAKISETSLEITELPVGTWTNTYKKFLESIRSGDNKLIEDYTENHTVTTVHFKIELTPENMAKAEKMGLDQAFKLTDTMHITNMVCFDSEGRLHRYTSPLEIIEEFYQIRLMFYHKRKAYLSDLLTNEWTKLNNQIRFILAVIDGELIIQNRPKLKVIQSLKDAGYDTWSSAGKASDKVDDDDDDDNSTSGYNYLLGMPLWNLTLEKVEKLKEAQAKKQDELVKFEAKTALDLWNEDLDNLLLAWDKLLVEDEEQLDDSKAYQLANAKKNKAPKKQAPRKKADPIAKKVKQEQLTSDSTSRKITDFDFTSTKDEIKSETKLPPTPKKPVQVKKPQLTQAHSDSDDDDYLAPISMRSKVTPTAKVTLTNSRAKKPQKTKPESPPHQSSEDEIVEIRASSRPKRQAAVKAAKTVQLLSDDDKSEAESSEEASEEAPEDDDDNYSDD